MVSRAGKGVVNDDFALYDNTGGAVRIAVKATSGNVGIGTTGPGVNYMSLTVTQAQQQCCQCCV